VAEDLLETLDDAFSAQVHAGVPLRGFGGSSQWKIE